VRRSTDPGGAAITIAFHRSASGERLVIFIGRGAPELGRQLRQGHKDVLGFGRYNFQFRSRVQVTCRNFKLSLAPDSRVSSGAMAKCAARQSNNSIKIALQVPASVRRADRIGRARVGLASSQLDVGLAGRARLFKIGKQLTNVLLCTIH
jgi:hypothetical protein